MSYSFCIKKCNMSTFSLTLNLSEDIYENYSYSTTHIQNVCFTHFITIYFLGTHIVSTYTAAKWVILISWLLYFLLTLILSEEMFPWIDKSKIRLCGKFSNTLKTFAMKSFSLISSICGSPKILRWPSFQVGNPATKWFIELHRFLNLAFMD